ncbi:hypothetical protein DXG03_005403 [Asterophora parasitica]|uniref:Amidase domain-containing protein n=1 Tax=Asterophora parasitica TaxID=117018 RepID=A0A9P7GBJ9_9AGAR|nr:hypothetical protein DXG03_005403 [Asterophora parasitica]
MDNTAFEIFGAGSAADFERDVVAHEPYLSSMRPDYDPLLTPADNYGPGITAHELWQLHETKRDLRQKYLEHWLATESETGTGRPVDAIISPVAANTAAPHGENDSFTYTLVFNTLDYPALVIPVSKVDQTLDAKKPAHNFLSEDDKRIYERYEPSRYTDAPIAVQVVGRTHEDEAVIALAEIVDAALKAQAASNFHVVDK